MHSAVFLAVLLSLLAIPPGDAVNQTDLASTVIEYPLRESSTLPAGMPPRFEEYLFSLAAVCGLYPEESAYFWSLFPTPPDEGGD